MTIGAVKLVELANNSPETKFVRLRVRWSQKIGQGAKVYSTG